MLDTVGIFLLQFKPVFPRRAIHHPVLMVDLVDAKQHALLVLPQIGEPFQIDGHRDFEVQIFELRDRVGYQVVVIEGRHGQFNPRHAAHLLCPKPCSIHHMFAGHGAFLGDHLPSFERLVQL